MTNEAAERLDAEKDCIPIVNVVVIDFDSAQNKWTCKRRHFEGRQGERILAILDAEAAQ